MTINFDDLDHIINIAENADIEALEVVNGDLRISVICHATQPLMAHNGLVMPAYAPSLPYASIANQPLTLAGALPQSHSTQANSFQSDSLQLDSAHSDGFNQAPADVADNNSDNNFNNDASNTDDADNTADSTDVTTIYAPMMGTFYRRPQPGADEFVNEGDRVKTGDSLCVIEAMKIMHEVKAEQTGVVTKILIEEGDVVEFGQALLEIR